MFDPYRVGSNPLLPFGLQLFGDLINISKSCANNKQLSIGLEEKDKTLKYRCQGH